MTATRIPSHDFKPVQQASLDGSVLICGYFHEVDDTTSVWCPRSADHAVHRGGETDVEVGPLEATR